LLVINALVARRKVLDVNKFNTHPLHEKLLNIFVSVISTRYNFLDV